MLKTLAVGIVPIIGEPADITNGLWYAKEGDKLNAGLSLGSAVPIAGYGALAAKYGDEVVAGAKIVDDVIEGAVNLTSKSVDDKLARYLLNMEHPVGSSKVK